MAKKSKKKVSKSSKVSKASKNVASKKVAKKAAPKKKYRSVVRIPSALLEETRASMLKLPDHVVEAVKSGISAVDKKQWPDTTTIVVNGDQFMFNTFALANLLGIR